MHHTIRETQKDAANSASPEAQSTSTTNTILNTTTNPSKKQGLKMEIPHAISKHSSSSSVDDASTEIYSLPHNPLPSPQRRPGHGHTTPA